MMTRMPVAFRRHPVLCSRWRLAARSLNLYNRTESKESLPRLTDSLLQRVAKGDASSVRGVLDRYGGLVWSLARRFCPTQADAEDAVQEIFLDVWKSAGRFDPAVAAEATFIAMIARRRLIDRRRRASRRVSEETGREELPVSTMPTEPDADLAEEAKLAIDALSTLRPDQQHVVRLSVMQGMSHEKIAEATGLPLGTVKTHARRGLLRVREILEQARSRKMGVAL